MAVVLWDGAENVVGRIDMGGCFERGKECLGGGYCRRVTRDGVEGGTGRSQVRGVDREDSIGR